MHCSARAPSKCAKGNETMIEEFVALAGLEDKMPGGLGGLLG